MTENQADRLIQELSGLNSSLLTISNSLVDIRDSLHAVTNGEAIDGARYLRVGDFVSSTLVQPR